jgi:hydrogenase maturation factor
MKSCETVELKIDKKDIALLKFIFEAYEGAGLTSTVDASIGKVIIMTPPGFRDEVFEILNSLEETINFEIV